MFDKFSLQRNLIHKWGVHKVKNKKKYGSVVISSTKMVTFEKNY